MIRPNSLQAILAREAAAPVEAPEQPAERPTAPPTPSRKPRSSAPAVEAEKPQTARFHRPSRDGRRFLGGHFPPAVVRQMKMLAVEEDTTTQALLEEALNLLFVKKGKGKIIGV